jgi:hypothetical protein
LVGKTAPVRGYRGKLHGPRGGLEHLLSGQEDRYSVEGEEGGTVRKREKKRKRHLIFGNFGGVFGNCIGHFL